VEGYAIDCEAGVDAVVSKLNAHAWVEYYDSSLRAWCVLEVTPGFEQPKKPEILGGRPAIGVEVPGNEVDTPEEDVPADDRPSKLPGRLPQWDELEDPTKPDLPEEKPTEKPPEEVPPTEEVPTDPTTIPENMGSSEDSNGDAAARNQRKLWRMLRKLIKILCSCLLCVGSVLLQGYVRIFRKWKLWNYGEPNALTVVRWRQIRSLAKRLKQPYPKELTDLAKKAKFSQHEIRPDELQKFEDYRLVLMGQLAQKPWYQRMYFKWIWAIDCK
jgi:hypothetical protein